MLREPNLGLWHLPEDRLDLPFEIDLSPFTHLVHQGSRIGLEWGVGRLETCSYNWRKRVCPQIVVVEF